MAIVLLISMSDIEMSAMSHRNCTFPNAPIGMIIVYKIFQILIHKLSFPPVMQYRVFLAQINQVKIVVNEKQNIIAMII